VWFEHGTTPTVDLDDHALPQTGGDDGRKAPDGGGDQQHASLHERAVALGNPHRHGRGALHGRIWKARAGRPGGARGCLRERQDPLRSLVRSRVPCALEEASL
jgi:hypothetical protein